MFNFSYFSFAIEWYGKNSTLFTFFIFSLIYFDKSFISGIKVKKDGTLSENKKLFDSAYYEEILLTVEEKIKEAIDSIVSSDFKINPKIVKGENISCKFCKYKDICYKKYKDSVIISLAGDEDE